MPPRGSTAASAHQSCPANAGQRSKFDRFSAVKDGSDRIDGHQSLAIGSGVSTDVIAGRTDWRKPLAQVLAEAVDDRCGQAHRH